MWAGIGIALGVIINPYFPADLVFTYRHFIPQTGRRAALQSAWGMNGIRMKPHNYLKTPCLHAGRAIVQRSPRIGIDRPQVDVRTATAFLIALLFGLMLFQARRFVEYFPALRLHIFAAFAWAPLFLDTETDPALRQNQRRSFRIDLKSNIPGLLLTVAVMAGIFKSIPAVQKQMERSKPYDLYSGASAWLVENTAEGERIFQTDWDDFPRLFFYNTHNTYLIGLDPTYLQLYDAEMYLRHLGKYRHSETRSHPRSLPHNSPPATFTVT